MNRERAWKTLVRSGKCGLVGIGAGLFLGGVFGEAFDSAQLPIIMVISTLGGGLVGAALPVFGEYVLLNRASTRNTDEISDQGSVHALEVLQPRQEEPQQSQGQVQAPVAAHVPSGRAVEVEAPLRPSQLPAASEAIQLPVPPVASNSQARRSNSRSERSGHTGSR
jgi:hypothetical protein